MNDDATPSHDPWADACVAAAMLTIDPAGLGGAVVRAMPGPVRERWLALVRRLLPGDAPWRRLPAHVTDDRLLGGLDLAATLQAGRPVAERGLLAEADGGLIVAAMAERASPAAVAHLGTALDRGEVVLERDGLGLRLAARVGVIALDEGQDEERVAPALADRLAFHLDLHGISVRDADDLEFAVDELRAARAVFAVVEAGDDVLEALCGAASALGINSLRAPLLAVRVARAAAALEGRGVVEAADAALAARLVLAPRATQLPFVEPPAEEAEPEAEPDPENREDDGQELQPPPEEVQRLEDTVLEAAAAAIPEGLLQMLRIESVRRSAQASGTAGAFQASKLRGRPLGTRRGLPRAGARLNLVETLRAAAPWQTLRRSTRPAAARRVEVRQDDFRVTRFKQRTESTAIFVVDASGSSALNRLAEAKGAVELLLADCYVRRDRVAVLAFRGTAAELILPPTRSLARAKRSLGGVPGGGGTPIAAALDAALALADQVRRLGQTPVVVLLTDGRANVARDGTGGRARAHEDALRSARLLGAAGSMTLLIDTSAKPEPLARDLAVAMGAHYLPLPRADARTLSAAVRSTGVLDGRA